MPVITAIHMNEYGFAPGTENIASVYADQQWILVATVIDRIQTGKEIFRSHNAFGPIVEVARSSSGRLYIRTESNNTTQDNLLSLPRR